MDPGYNLIGFQIDGETVNGKYGNGSGWLGFQWVSINYVPLTTLNIEPADWQGKPGQTQVFTATSPTTLDGIRFQWFVNDIEVQNGPEPQLEFSSPVEGEYRITVKAWEDTFNELEVLQTASATADTTGSPVTTVPQGQASVKILAPKNGTVLASPDFTLNVAYTLSQPAGDIFLEIELLSGTITLPVSLGDAPTGVQVVITASVEDASDQVILDY